MQNTVLVTAMVKTIIYLPNPDLLLFNLRIFYYSVNTAISEKQLQFCKRKKINERSI